VVNSPAATSRTMRRTLGHVAFALAIGFTLWLPAGLLQIVPFVLRWPGESSLRSHAALAVTWLLLAAWAYWNEPDS
jgi:hypothetical protein